MIGSIMIFTILNELGRRLVGLGERLLVDLPGNYQMVRCVLLRMLALVCASVYRLAGWIRRHTPCANHVHLLDQSSSGYDVLPIRTSRMPRASWVIVEETALLCRAQLGLDRSTDPNDVATRALVKKTVFGILSDTAVYPSLRRVDAARLVPFAAELALTPTDEEVEALVIGSSAPLMRNRVLARGAWGVEPSTWFEWVRSLFGLWTGGQYLSPVQNPSF